MATSPKFRTAAPARLPAGVISRRYTGRQLVVLLAFALIITSGSMLIFHVVTSPAAASSRHSGPGCNKDAEFSVIRWKTNTNNQVNQDLPYNPDLNRDRPRVALPHPANQEQDGFRPQNQNQNQEPGQQQPQEQKQLNSDQTEAQVKDNNDSDSTVETEDVSSQKEPEQHRPFEESLNEKDGVQYLTYLPYAGITNQFYGMLRGMELAKKLGRTLIIPPITASSHDKSKQNQPWSKFLDLKRFQELTGSKVVEFHELRDAELTEYNALQCRITCGFGSKRTIDFTAKGFLKQWKLDVTLSPLRLDATKLDSIASILTPHRKEKYICISNTYKIAVADKSEWDRFGQHLHFTPELEDFVQEFLDKNLEKPSPVYDPELRQEVVPKQPYVAIHVRRGDFAQYCESNFAGARMAQCLPSTEQIAQRVDTIQTRFAAQSSENAMMPVFVATNERRPEELKKFADLGWRYLDHDEMGTAEKLGVFGPMMVDQVFMAHAQALVGIQMSTFSRVGALRQRDWHDRKMEYM
ncbi:hypothetical protein BGW38_007403 [Lunasporangiospora selenospora]|uniref:GDP-fucose protein O-fucosyltransferase 2 n=1 Tax=Lunasporangiospora selenospora TaxID=979761 RepID=A0A9P6FMG3_9FUNG|nr:hypothetical protein BGW38_007403 [Lunasporangiospora selenospora]